MDLATLIGLIGGIGIVIWAILLGGDPTAYFDIPAALMVIGGSTFVVLIKFSLRQFLGALKVVAKALSSSVESPENLISKIIELAYVSRKSGLLALEKADVDNDFLKKGIQYIIDGLDAEMVRATLTKELVLTLDRHEVGQRIFKSIGEVAPAMGMISTLVGLVKMMGAMADPKAIGPAMAIALLGTLYGAVLANIIAFPIADKLSLRSREERRIKSLLIDAILGIQSGQNPRLLEELLKSYLPESSRVKQNAATLTETKEREARAAALQASKGTSPSTVAKTGVVRPPTAAKPPLKPPLKKP